MRLSALPSPLALTRPRLLGSIRACAASTLTVISNIVGTAQPCVIGDPGVIHVGTRIELNLELTECCEKTIIVRVSDEVTIRTR